VARRLANDWWTFRVDGHLQVRSTVFGNTRRSGAKNSEYPSEYVGDKFFAPCPYLGNLIRWREYGARIVNVRLTFRSNTTRAPFRNDLPNQPTVWFSNNIRSWTTSETPDKLNGRLSYSKLRTPRVRFWFLANGGAPFGSILFRCNVNVTRFTKPISETTYVCVFDTAIRYCCAFFAGKRAFNA